MRRHTYGTLSVIAFALIVVSFVILGFSRIVLPYHTARVLAAPTLLGGFVLVCFLFVRGVLSWTGVSRLE
ncbi:SurA N-terminal domain-containing protein [Halocatena salina]|uniref:SurA N-terminal domain-containing protein n=1 Tax=Halocatena salina TaxID=2934340 RepID=A0A8U0A303_9EURY|nr:SurA N-terminal domain-containing protein [Halocatena salina]UPM43565.1 SurA N-terminal domain-containing protein [Halocatena salina]